MGTSPRAETQRPAEHSRARTAARLCLVVLLLFGTAFASVPVTAGDNVALFYVEPDEVDADPGETVTLEVVMSTHGGWSGEGVGDAALAVETDSDALIPVAIDPGPFLAGDGSDLEVRTNVDEENASAWISQKRVPAGDGATGTEPVATVTLAVAADAEPTSATVSIVGSQATLVSEIRQATMTREATVHVDGGEPDDASDDGSPEGVTLAEDEPPTGDDADAIPGFGHALAVGVLALVLTARYARTR
ncbi:cohesin domain-containing protein [Natronobiforma cellulositropha]|uniref:cohesin domain-containing protein n=1 Tax=Natronobiforma cellulositropha TaxID=1679076 RepID=UPI0021D59809|nr:cohesin domain-containing protein [Natronobiforma cellulositropha]